MQRTVEAKPTCRWVAVSRIANGEDAANVVLVGHHATETPARDEMHVDRVVSNAEPEAHVF